MRLLRRPIEVISALVALLLLVAVPLALAADPKPARRLAEVKPKPEPTNQLDDELLRDLDNELLDGVKDPPSRKPPKGDSAGKGNTPDKSDPGDGERGPAGAGEHAEPQETAGEDAQQGDDPLMRIGRRMRSVEELIAAKRNSAQAEEWQQEIVDDLESLIKKIEEQASQSKSSGKSQSKAGEQPSGRDQVKQPMGGAGQSGEAPAQSPARESSQRLGKHDARPPDAEQMKGLLKDVWGQLPAHAREQMLQSPPERFLPKYELMLEKYYKRLAEEQKAKP